MTQDPKNLVRTRHLRTDDATHLKHPMNPKSEIFVHGLSERAGMQRQHMIIARIPPSKENFGFGTTYHVGKLASRVIHPRRQQRVCNANNDKQTQLMIVRQG